MPDGKLFTQDEVNQIVSRRLNEERTRNRHTDGEYSELENRYNDLLQQVHNEKVARMKAAKKEKLVKSLAEGGALAPGDMASMLEDNVIESENGELGYKLNNGTVLSVTDGVKNWLHEHPWAVKADIQTGAGIGNTISLKPGDIEQAEIRKAMGLQ